MQRSSSTLSVLMRRLTRVISAASASVPSSAPMPAALPHARKNAAERSARSRARASTRIVAPSTTSDSRFSRADRSGPACGSIVTSISLGSGRSRSLLGLPSQGSTRAFSSSGGTATAEVTPRVRRRRSTACATFCSPARPSSTEGRVTVTSSRRRSYRRSASSAMAATARATTARYSNPPMVQGRKRLAAAVAERQIETAQVHARQSQSAAASAESGGSGPVSRPCARCRTGCG